MTKCETFTNELQQLAMKFRTNGEPTGMKEIDVIVNKIMADHDVLIHCNLGELSNIILAMQECTARADFIGLADYLAYDLVRAINNH